jgi:hypothetical protein
MYSSVLTTVEDVSRPEAVRPPLREPVCAECRYAQVFAVQPRAVCMHTSAMRAGRTLCAGEAACADFAMRETNDLSMSAVAASGRAPSSQQL